MQANSAPLHPAGPTPARPDFPPPGKPTVTPQPVVNQQQAMQKASSAATGIKPGGITPGAGTPPAPIQQKHRVSFNPIATIKGKWKEIPEPYRKLIVTTLKVTLVVACIVTMVALCANPFTAPVAVFGILAGLLVVGIVGFGASAASTYIGKSQPPPQTNDANKKDKTEENSNTPKPGAFPTTITATDDEIQKNNQEIQMLQKKVASGPEKLALNSKLKELTDEKDELLKSLAGKQLTVEDQKKLEKLDHQISEKNTEISHLEEQTKDAADKLATLKERNVKLLEHKDKLFKEFKDAQLASPSMQNITPDDPTGKPKPTVTSTPIGASRAADKKAGIDEQQKRKDSQLVRNFSENNLPVLINQQKELFAPLAQPLSSSNNAPLAGPVATEQLSHVNADFLALNRSLEGSSKSAAQAMKLFPSADLRDDEVQSIGEKVGTLNTLHRDIQEQALRAESSLNNDPAMDFLNPKNQITPAMVQNLENPLPDDLASLTRLSVETQAWARVASDPTISPATRMIALTNASKNQAHISRLVAGDPSNPGGLNKGVTDLITKSNAAVSDLNTQISKADPSKKDALNRQLEIQNANIEDLLKQSETLNQINKNMNGVVQSLGKVDQQALPKVSQGKFETPVQITYKNNLLNTTVTFESPTELTDFMKSGSMIHQNLTSIAENVTRNANVFTLSQKPAADELARFRNVARPPQPQVPGAPGANTGAIPPGPPPSPPPIPPASVLASANTAQVAGSKQPLATPTGLLDYNENNAEVQTYIKNLLLQGAATIAKAPKGVSLGLDTYNFLAYALFHASENKPKDMEVRFHLPSGHRYRIPNPNTRQILYGQVVEINGIMTAASEFQEINRERKRLGQPLVEKMFIPSVAKENGKVDHGLLTVIEADPHDDLNVKVSIINPLGAESYKESQNLLAQGIKNIFPKASFILNQKQQQTDNKFCGMFQLMNVAALSKVDNVQDFVQKQQLAPVTEQQIESWFSTDLKPKLAEVASNILKQ